MVLERHATDTRSNILAAGQALIAQKGFCAVGLAEILKTAGVPKGSFYHYFGSKDDFGVSLLEAYFDAYHAEMDRAFARPGLTGAETLMLYFSNWQESQSANACQGRCLVVKLGAEVSDFSDPMRRALDAGTDGIVARLATVLHAGRQDGSLRLTEPEPLAAAALYQLWIGASVMAKIARRAEPFDVAMRTTRTLLSEAGTGKAGLPA